MTIRVGILGGGNISDTHARAALEIPGVEIGAVYGRNAERSGALVEKYGGTQFTDLDAFFAHRPLDLVLIGSPSGLHAEQASAAVRSGLHVLSEKPLDVSTAKVDELIRAAADSGLKVGVFFQNRASPDIAWLKRLVDAGGLGRVFLASAQVKWYRPPEYYSESRWRGTWALDGGGALMNQGIHTIDLLLWLLGDAERIYARTRTALHEIEVEDTVVACLDFAGGAVATFEATTAAYPGFPRRLELTGTEGTVVVEGDRVTHVGLRTPPAEPPPESASGAAPAAGVAAVADASGHRIILEDFIEAMRTGREPLCGAVDGRRSVATVEAIYRSAREGVPVQPE